jgi:hypothetical protein
MIYTIYTSNGQITKIVACDNIQEQLAAGEYYIDGNYPDNKYYIDNGIPVEFPYKSNEYLVFDFTTKQWVDPRTPATQWDVVKNQKNKLLQASDWTDTVSAPGRLGATLYNEWQVYRQSLRDVMRQSDPFNIVWPTPPQG